MSRTSRYAFLLAKLYGMLAHSYLGASFRDLLRLKKLTELYDLLYPGERPQQPDHTLAVELEARIVRASIDAMRYVLESLDEPAEILVHILRKLELQSLKAVIRGMTHERTEPPRIWDLGPYAAVRLSDPKDYKKAVAASPYAWVLPLVETTPMAQIENRLDRDYYTKLLALARALPRQDRTGVLRLVGHQIVLANVVWALRLRFFFRMDGEAARALLIPGMGSVQREAVWRAFEIPADSADQWRKWKYAWLVEDQLGESFQAPDPIRAELKAGQALYVRAHQLFHQNPFTLTPLVAFFTLKEHEAGLLKTAVEALKLALPEHELLAMVGET
jgi:vacuolar-type H+-ATPase subunit C/Vma6